ncbi:MAG: hypothetical protein DRP20_05790, partial [Thermotogae bacterium]
YADDENGDDATPPYRIVNFTLNVTDIPPAIENVSIEPYVFEIYYESTNISSIITDNFAVDKAWINATRPDNSSYVDFMNNNESLYTINYNTTISGVHSIEICANDTASLVSCTSPFDIIASGNTSIEAMPNSTLVEVANITIYEGANFILNITANNTGYSRAKDVNVTIVTPNNINSSKSLIEFGLLLKNSWSSNITNISVRESTPPGDYLVNLTANWTNLDNTSDWSISNVTVNILSNPVIDILNDTINITAQSGNSDIENMTLMSIGNDEVDDITISCISGEVCQNFTVEIEPNYISLLQSGNMTSVRINVTVPDSYPTGTYSGIIDVNSQNTSDSVPLYVNVPLNLSWSQSPSEISKRVIKSKDGSFSGVNIKNTGNSPLRLDIIWYGNVTPYLTKNATELYLDIGEEKYVEINYSAPDVNQESVYTGYVKSRNTTTTPSEKSTFLNMSVYPFSVDIIEPTQTQPATNVTYNETIEAKVNVTYGLVWIISGLDWEVRIENYTSSIEANITNAQFSSVEKLWHINFTSPDLEDNHAYNLNITANYTDKNLVLSDIEHNSIVYVDTIAPLVNIYVPEKVASNSTVEILSNGTDSGGIRNITGIVTYPDNTTEQVVFDFTEQIGNVYMYKLDFSNTSQMGIYKINVTACDLSSNCNSTNTTFGVYPMICFAGHSIDIEDPDEPTLHVGFSFYDPGTSTLLYYIQSDTNGYYNETIDARSYDMYVNIWNDSLKLYDSSIIKSTNDPMLFGYISPTLIGKGSLKGMAIENTLNFSVAKLTFDYSEFSDITVSNLGIYSCEDWDRYSGCDGDWTRLSSTTNTNSSTISTTIRNKIEKAYALAEYVCGNGVCEYD